MMLDNLRSFIPNIFSGNLAAKPRKSKDFKPERDSRISSTTASVQNVQINTSPLPVEPQECDVFAEDRVSACASDEEYPVGIKLSLIVLALCLSVFVMALDNSIISTAIPRITDEFNSLNDVGWYGSAYLLTTASLQLLYGKLYTIFSIKSIYLIAITLFELGSLVCGISPNSTSLILGRAVAGLGGAGIYVGSLIVLTHTVPLKKRPVYTSLVSSMWGVSSVAGPLLGGLLTDSLSWRWCFYINLPIGAITVLVIMLYFPDPMRSATQRTWRSCFICIDPLGNLLFMPAIICLLLALHWGGIRYPWTSPHVMGLLVAFATAISAFVYLQCYSEDHAMVPLRIFTQRSVWSSSFYAFNLGAAYLLSVYFLPIWFQTVKGASAVTSGVMNLPLLVAVVIFSIVAGTFVTAWGYYAPWMILGSVLMAVGYGLISTFNSNTPSCLLVGFQILAGAGVGVGMQQPLMAVQVVLDPADLPTGTAIIVFMQTIGGAIFVAVGQMAFTNNLLEGIVQYVPDMDPHIIMASGVTAIRQTIAPELLPGITHAYNSGLAKTFLISAITASATIIGSLCVEWKSIKGKNVHISMA